jgi:uncharacterized membrane protein HdeD (DUF308 family)
MTTMRNTNENTKGNKKVGALLWTLQGLLAALFLFAGAMKLIMPIETLVAQSSLPGWFLLFIGVAEVLGALGLILPGLARVQTQLTPLAAAGLVIIMFGATTLGLADGQGAMVTMPAVIGLLAAFIAYGRTQLVPHRESRRAGALQTAA